jgi:hypothetical protein
MMMSSSGSRSSWDDSSQPFDEDEIDFFADLDGDKETTTETPSLFSKAAGSSSPPRSSTTKTKTPLLSAQRTTAVATTTSTTTTTSELGEEQQGVEVFPRPGKTKQSSSLPTIVESTRNATAIEPKGRQELQHRQELGQSQSQPDQDETEKLRQAELALRHKVATGGGCCGGTTSIPPGLLLWTRFFINNYSAVLVFGKHLISLESLLSIALSISMTICKSAGPVIFWKEANEKRSIGNGLFSFSPLS